MGIELITVSVRRTFCAALVAGVTLALSTVASAQDVSMPAKAQVCVSCHGAGGNSTITTIPNR